VNRSALSIAGLVVLAAIVLGVFTGLFIVNQNEQALVLQFGQPQRVIREAGLHFKKPFLIEEVVRYDRRVLDFEPPSEEVIASDQKRLVVDSFARFRIIDPLLFFQSVGTEIGARGRLGATISGSLRRVLGGVTLASVLSDERDRIMRQITEEVSRQARAFGIEVIDVRLRRADLPEENSQAIYARMQSEREREAREFRAQGAEFAQRIRSVAERERTVLIAEAQREAQIKRGQGDGESVKIYADAFGRDPSFFAFYRSMQAYREALGNRDTTMVLSPDSEFFRYFNAVDGGNGRAAGTGTGTGTATGTGPATGGAGNSGGTADAGAQPPAR
jgi:membrane protease subunit HflC